MALEYVTSESSSRVNSTWNLYRFRFIMKAILTPDLDLKRVRVERAVLSQTDYAAGEGDIVRFSMWLLGTFFLACMNIHSQKIPILKTRKKEASFIIAFRNGCQRKKRVSLFSRNQTKLILDWCNFSCIQMLCYTRSNIFSHIVWNEGSSDFGKESINLRGVIQPQQIVTRCT